MGWPRRRERAIKLMNGRLMDFIPLLWRKTREMHIRFFLCFESWRKLLVTNEDVLPVHFHARVILAAAVFVIFEPAGYV